MCCYFTSYIIFCIIHSESVCCCVGLVYCHKSSTNVLSCGSVYHYKNILCYSIYRNTIIIIYYLYCYYNWWQLTSDNSYGYSMCCLRTFCVFFLYIFVLSQYTLYCYALCQIKYCHIPYHI